jgi:signal transduction histidine kinase
MAARELPSPSAVLLAGGAVHTLRNDRDRLQVDWLIGNLRWLLLGSVILVGSADILVTSGTVDVSFLVPQIVVLFLAILYNVGVTVLVYRCALASLLPVATLLVDAGFAVGFVIASGGLTSPLLYTVLFPILTAALRFSWVASLLISFFAIAVSAIAGYAIAPADVAGSRLTSFLLVRSPILIVSSLLVGLVRDRINRLTSRALRAREEGELRKLRAAQEHSRVIFELASTLSATLNYNKVLEAVLEVGEAGMRDLGRANPAHVSMVMLFSHSDLRIVACRHLPPRDQGKTFQGKRGILARALASAELVVIDQPGNDPELGQLVMMHSCQQAVIVPLRAGFENFGVVVFGSPQPNTYTQDHQNLLTAICNQAIVALQNAQLYQSLMEEKERIVEVEEDARKKLSRDLHDGPTQSIAAIAMRVNYARTLLEKKRNVDETAEELERVEELARRTTKDIRQMLFTLRPLVLETQGLTAALEQLIAKLAETESATRFRLDAMPEVDKVVDRNAQGVLFYIIEEAMGNARKHARARNVRVRLTVREGMFVAEVADDGRGFDVEAVQLSYDERGSLGMINMHERAEMIGGKLIVASAPGKGTRITITVPMRRR